MRARREQELPVVVSVRPEDIELSEGEPPLPAMGQCLQGNGQR